MSFAGARTGTVDHRRCGGVVSADLELDAFCQREFPRLVGQLTLYCGERDLAEELAQEALVKVVRRWSDVSEMTAPGAWVHRVAINLANSWFRRKKAALRATVRHASGTEPDRHHDPDGADAIALRRAVSRLPQRRRTALVLRYYADLPARQVAQIMEIEPASVNSHVSRALEDLRDALGLGIMSDDTEVSADV